MRFTQAQVKYWLSKLRYFFFEQKKGDTKKIQEENCIFIWYKVVKGVCLLFFAFFEPWLKNVNFNYFVRQ